MCVCVCGGGGSSVKTETRVDPNEMHRGWAGCR